MTFRFKDGKVEIDMIECIKNVMKEFLVKFGEIFENQTPARVDLFSGDTSKKLNKEMKTIFQQRMAQGLFVCKQAQPDTQPTIAVSCTRVKSPRQRGWNKLVRLMKCLHSTVNDTPTLDAGNRVHNVEWSMDSAFGVHPDLRAMPTEP